MTLAQNDRHDAGWPTLGRVACRACGGSRAATGSVTGVALTGIFASLVVNAAGVSAGRLHLVRQSVLAVNRPRIPVRDGVDHSVGHGQDIRSSSESRRAGRRPRPEREILG